LDAILGSVVALQPDRAVQRDLMVLIRDGVEDERIKLVCDGMIWQVDALDKPTGMVVDGFDSRNYRGDDLLVVFLPDESIRWKSVVTELKSLGRKQELQRFKLVTVGQELDPLSEFWTHFKLGQADELLKFGISERPVYVVFDRNGKVVFFTRNLSPCEGYFDGSIGIRLK